MSSVRYIFDLTNSLKPWNISFLKLHRILGFPHISNPTLTLVYRLPQLCATPAAAATHTTITTFLLIHQHAPVHLKSLPLLQLSSAPSHSSHSPGLKGAFRQWGVVSRTPTAPTFSKCPRSWHRQELIQYLHTGIYYYSSLTENRQINEEDQY